MFRFSLSHRLPHALLLFIPVFLVLQLLPLAAHGETDTDVQVLDTMKVTAEKSDNQYRTGDVAMSETPVFATVIKRESFEGKPLSLSEVIEKETGIQVRSTGGLGSFSSVSLRGSSSEQVMIYLDGVLLNDSSGGGVDLSTISLTDVAQIEIYRGATPVSFSKASIGGVVNIRTLRSTEGTGGSVVLGMGSFNTKRASASISYKQGKGDVLVSAGTISADNDFEIFNDNGTSWNKNDDRTEDRNNAGVEQHNVLSRVGWDFTDHLRASLSSQWFKKDQELPTTGNSELVTTTLDTERSITTLNLTADNLTSLGLNTSLSFSYLYKKETYDDREGRIGLGKQHNRYRTDKMTTSFFAELPLESHIISFNGEFFREEYSPTNLLRESNFQDSTRDYFSLGLQDSILFSEGRLIVTPSVSYINVHDELKSGTASWGSAIDARSDTMEFFSPRIGFRFTPWEHFTFKSNLGRYHREPSFFELYGDRGLFVGNADLTPESGVNFDAGFEFNRSFQNGPVREFSFTANYYKTHVDDLIARVYDARGVGKSQNISDGRIQGVELSFSAHVTKFLRFTGGVTFQDTENVNPFEVFDGKKLPGSFERAYRGRVDFLYNPFTLFFEAVYEEGLFYDTANLLSAPNKKEINTGISFSMEPLMVDFTIKNLTDELYEDFNGYPLPGRSFDFSVRYRF